MIDQFLKAKRTAHGMSSADLARVTHLPMEDIAILLQGTPFFSVVHAEIVLRYFGAELAVCSGGEAWAKGKWTGASIQENLFELFRHGEKSVLDGKVSSALEMIESAREMLAQSSVEYAWLDLTLGNLQTVNQVLLDEVQKQELLDTIAKVQQAILRLSQNGKT